MRASCSHGHAQVCKTSPLYNTYVSTQLQSSAMFERNSVTMAMTVCTITQYPTRESCSFHVNPMGVGPASVFTCRQMASKSPESPVLGTGLPDAPQAFLRSRGSVLRGAVFKGAVFSGAVFRGTAGPGLVGASTPVFAGALPFRVASSSSTRAFCFRMV